MPKICYIPKNFREKSLTYIAHAIRIIEEYQAQGFNLTLRQLYYQFVARDLIPNIQKEYQKLVNIISDARLAGLIDWNSIEDRTRELKDLPHWSSPASILRAAASGYRIDKWNRQPYRVEVWIEKDALTGVIEGVCKRWDVPYFSCRGYNSQSEMWVAGQRLINHSQDGQRCLVLHLGDHDPSGLDMTRDIRERLITFMRYEGVEPASVERIALNQDQISQYNPPPNPTKLSDSRADWYISQHGFDCWELDALDPKVIEQLIEDAITDVVDIDVYNEDLQEEANQRDSLIVASQRWNDIKKYLEVE